MNKEEAEKLIDDYITAFYGLSQAMRTGTIGDYGSALLLYASAKDKLLAALSPEPNQPKGSGDYWLITKASVTNGPLHPIVRIGNLSHLLVSDITGHWQPIYTPDKESLNNNADEQSNKILNICGYYD